MISVTKSKDVLIASVQRLNDIDVGDNVPNIQIPSLAIEIEPGATSNRFINADAYNTKFTAELKIVSQLDCLALRGEEFVSMLYSMRSIAKAIPMLVSYFLIVLVYFVLHFPVLYL